MPFHKEKKYIILSHQSTCQSNDTGHRGVFTTLKKWTLPSLWGCFWSPESLFSFLDSMLLLCLKNPYCLKLYCVSWSNFFLQGGQGFPSLIIHMSLIGSPEFVSLLIMILLTKVFHRGCLCGRPSEALYAWINLNLYYLCYSRSVQQNISFRERN